MSHELEMIGNDASMVYVGDTPWHGLGTKIPDNLTPSEVLRAANLDWNVIKVDQFIELNGDKILTGQKALVRDSDNSILTYVSDGWEPVQNSDAFSFFNDFIEAGNMKLHTAGSIMKGKKVWALAKVEDDFELPGHDKIESYLLFSNPHQYGQSIDIRFTPIRVVCNNTLTLSLNGKSDLMVRLNHSSPFNPDMARAALTSARGKNMQYKEAAEFLTSKRFTDASLMEYFNEVFPKTNKKEKFELPESITSLLNITPEFSRNAKKIYELMDTQPGATMSEGSWWQALNAVTYFTDHVSGRSNDTRLASSWYGANRQVKLKALNKALEFANNS